MEIVCLKCGDIGFPEAIVTCNRCEAYGLHSYCLDGPVNFDDDVTWVCEVCEPIPIAEGRTSLEPEHPQCNISCEPENKSKSESGPVPRDVSTFNKGLERIIASDCHAQPIANPIWRGSVHVSHEAIGTVMGLMAHLSNLACTKAIEETKLLPEMLFADLPPKSVVWPPSFIKEAPNDKSIALYFIPETEISEKVYDVVVDDINRMEVAIRVVTPNAVLLIFPSTLLQVPHRRFNGKYYLWGVFRRKQT